MILLLPLLAGQFSSNKDQRGVVKGVPSFEEPHQPHSGKLITLTLIHLGGEAIHLAYDTYLGYEFAFLGYWVLANRKTCRVFDVLTFGLR